MKALVYTNVDMIPTSDLCRWMASVKANISMTKDNWKIIRIVWYDLENTNESCISEKHFSYTSVKREGLFWTKKILMATYLRNSSETWRRTVNEWEEIVIGTNSNWEMIVSKYKHLGTEDFLNLQSDYKKYRAPRTVAIETIITKNIAHLWLSRLHTKMRYKYTKLTPQNLTKRLSVTVSYYQLSRRRQGAHGAKRVVLRFSRQNRYHHIHWNWTLPLWPRRRTSFVLFTVRGSSQCVPPPASSTLNLALIS